MWSAKKWYQRVITFYFPISADGGFSLPFLLLRNLLLSFNIGHGPLDPLINLEVHA